MGGQRFVAAVFVAVGHPIRSVPIRSIKDSLIKGLLTVARQRLGYVHADNVVTIRVSRVGLE